MSTLALDEGVRLLAAARKSAEDMGARVTIAVLDPRGDLIALHRIDEASGARCPSRRGRPLRPRPGTLRAATCASAGTNR